MVRIALGALSLTVALAAAGAVLQVAPFHARAVATDQPPAVGSATATAPAPAPEQTDELHAAGNASTADTEPVGFTVGDLHDGEVSAARFAAFWDAEVERTRTAACPSPTAAGTTVVVATVGATPPPHLGDEYTDYAPVLAAARIEAAAACA